MNKKMMRQIQHKLDGSYAQKIRLSDLAEEYHISTSHLSHSFKLATGYAVMEYLTARRISAAKELLAQTDMTVTEIVYAVGFADSSNFSRAFKKATGYTPVSYRSMMGKDSTDIELLELAE